LLLVGNGRELPGFKGGPRLMLVSVE